MKLTSMFCSYAKARSIIFPLFSLDPTATHFLLRLLPSLMPVGTIRLVKGLGYYKLSRLAVLKDYRQYRFGRALVLTLHDFVRHDAKGNGEMDCVRIVSHSQIPVKGFYSKCALLSLEPNTSMPEPWISI